MSFSQSGSIEGGTFGFGGVRSWEDASRSLNMSLSNSFDIKTEHDGDERSFTLATVGLFTGYDFDEETLKWRPLRTSASIKPDSRIDVRMDMTHLLYDENNQRSLSHPRLRRFTVTSNFYFQGRIQDEPEESPSNQLLDPIQSQYGFEENLYDNAYDSTQPWRFSLSHRYEFQKGTNFTSSLNRSWVKANLGLNPTPNLRIDYAINYDLVHTRTTAQSIALYRSLHCWEARFSWNPTGITRGFYFKINIKDIPQIKYEHKGGGLGL